MAEPIIQLRDLRKSYGAVEALRGVTVDVPGGGAVGLLGPNGAGKSTLLRLLLGLLVPSSGSASVLGMDVATRPLDIRARVGYLPEDDCHIPGLTAVGYVAYAAELSGLPPKDALRRSHEALDYVGMDEERYRRVETYSQGMRQRIKLAQAIVHDPELLLLDEPTNGMDPAGRDDMLALIRDISTRAGVNALVSSHLLHDVEEICSHVVVLGMGEVRLQGDLAGLRRTEGNAYDVRIRGDAAALDAGVKDIGGEVTSIAEGLLRVTLPAGVRATRLVEIADARKIQLRYLHSARNTLEEVFMRAIEEE